MEFAISNFEIKSLKNQVLLTWMVSQMFSQVNDPLKFFSTIAFQLLLVDGHMPLKHFLSAEIGNEK